MGCTCYLLKVQPISFTKRFKEIAGFQYNNFDLRTNSVNHKIIIR
jgi:hypothetical protein